MKRVYFVRHGETEGNIGKYFQFPDTVLSPSGHKGAVAIAERLKNLGIEELLVSPYKRAQQTAEYISTSTHQSIVNLEDLHEIESAVSVRGKKWDSPEGIAYNNLKDLNFLDSEWQYDGAENYAKVLDRVKNVVEYLEKSQSKNIAVVSHGLFLNAMFVYLLLGKSTDVNVHKLTYSNLHLMSNVAITEFIFNDNCWKLFTFNDHAHFAE